MKKILLILILFFMIGCFTVFEKTEKLMGQFKLKDGSVINLFDAGTGATSPDVIWIDKIDGKGEKVSVDSINRTGRIYEVSFEQINDTLLNITLTDTVVLKGEKIERVVNLKNRIE